MSRLKLANLLFFQWFFIRLARIIGRDNEGYRSHSWGLIGPVLPLTGWGSDYIGYPNVFVQWRGSRP